MRSGLWWSSGRAIEGRAKSMRRYPLIVVIGLGLVVAAGLAVGIVNEWKFRTELRQVSLDLAARRVGMAKARLDRLAERWPGRGEVEYWLGACERAVGHTDAALAAWGRVPDTAPVARLAALERGRLALETYHYALAESCLERADPRGGRNRQRGAASPGTALHGDRPARGLPARLAREVEREPDPTANLRTLWQIDHMPYPVQRARQELEHARGVAPDDDRVWLALADLATRTGRFEEAEEWLMRCERARPDDRAVWRARLDWAQAADRPDEVVRAASHLPVSLVTQAHVLELRAWMAARCGDRQAERAALESKLAIEPADSAAVERLADLAAQDGERERRRRAAAPQGCHRRRARALSGVDPHPRPDDAHPRACPCRRGQRSVVRRQGMVGPRGPARSIHRRRGPGRSRSPGHGRAGARARRDGRWPTCLGRSGRGSERRPRSPALRTFRHSPTTPSDAALLSPSTTGTATSTSSLKPSVVEWPSWTSTAMDGSISMPFRGDRSPPRRLPALRRPPLPQPRRRSVR